MAEQEMVGLAVTGFVAITIKNDGSYELNSNIEDPEYVINVLLDAARRVLPNMRKEKPIIAPASPELVSKFGRSISSTSKEAPIREPSRSISSISKEASIREPGGNTRKS